MRKRGGKKEKLEKKKQKERNKVWIEARQTDRQI